MRRRRRGLIWKLTVIVTLAIWGLLLGMSSGGKLASDKGPFDETVWWCLGVLLLLSLLCAVPTETRPLARTLSVAAIAFTVALLAGHLVGSSATSPAGVSPTRRR